MTDTAPSPLLDRPHADLALAAKAWPFEEARKLIARFGSKPPAKGYALFETGYGPSGLPHIGTFGEVARTSMVRRAFAEMSGLPTKLICFSDDMDGMRKVPDNVPNTDLLRQHLGQPLTRVPDPFGTHESFGHHNNARLRAFLDAFGFEYEFMSATECYLSGKFDAVLQKVLENYDAVMAVMLPSLRAERAATYSPFLPVCPTTGKVLQVPVLEARPQDGTIIYEDEDGSKKETPVTGGRCKLQWKVDWAARWAALGVDYEMAGKDHIDGMKLSGAICRILGGRQPDGFNYELFLDDKGEKISKSKGNGLTMDEWLTYATPESLALFMYQKPKTAKKLYFDVIPKAVDEYLTWLEKYPAQDLAERLENPAWHIHAGAPPAQGSPLSFAILLNLASVCNAEDPHVLWGFIARYVPGATPESEPLLNRLVGYALAYYRDFVKPAKKYRAPTTQERAALEDLLITLRAMPSGADADAMQTQVFEVGKRHGFENLRDWFKALYEILLGQDQGPRMGSFIALYGQAETCALIEKVLDGQPLG